MDTRTKCIIVMYCALYITAGLIFNKMTFELLQPSYISQRTITIDIDPSEIEIMENIDKKDQTCEIPAFVVIFIYDLIIILSTMLPKTTVDDCKKSYERVGRWSHITYLASLSVSSQCFVKKLKAIVLVYFNSYWP